MTLAPVAERLAGELSLPVLTTRFVVAKILQVCYILVNFLFVEDQFLMYILPKVSLGIRLRLHHQFSSRIACRTR